MEATVLTTLVLPIALGIIMLGMGLSLVPGDFQRVMRVPKAFAIGALCQLVMLPVVGFGIAMWFDLPPRARGGSCAARVVPGRHDLEHACVSRPW